jgi:outer membrane protein
MRLVKLMQAVGVACVLAAPAAQAETLTDALVSAYRNSNLLEQNRAVFRAASEDAALAVSALRPVVNFIASASAQIVTTTSLSASLQVTGDITVYDFGRGELSINAAHEQVLATQSALVALEQRVLLNAVAAYMDVRGAADTVELREANVRLITQELRAANERFEVGEVTRTDVAIAEARLAASRSELAGAQGDSAIAREGYNIATGHYPGPLSPPPTLPHTARSMVDAQAIARQTHPSIAQSQHELAAADMNVQRVILQRSGSVTARAAAGVTATNSGNGAAASLGLTYQRSIYQGGRMSALERQAVARQDAARAGLQQTVASVLQNVGVAWANFERAAARIEASDRQIRASQTAYDGVSEEATLGSRTTLDVLNAEQELLDARTSRVAAAANVQLAAYSVLETMGLLTVEHLNLGIPTYDPEAYYSSVRDAPYRSPQGEALDRVLRSIGQQQ